MPDDDRRARARKSRDTSRQAPPAIRGGPVRGLLFAATVLLATLAWSVPADACEIGYCVDDVVPKDGAEAVPTDAHVWVFFTRTPLEDHGPDIELRDEETGEAVDIDVERYPGGNQNAERRRRVAVVEPRQPLDEKRTYRLALGGPDVCNASDVVFTTGTTSAEPAPSPGAPLSGSVSCDPGPETPDTCQDQSEYPVYRFSISPQTAASEAAAYQLVHDGEVVAIQQTPPVTVNTLPAETGDEACFQLRAINLAGTEGDPGQEVCVDTTDAACMKDDGADAGGTDTGPDAGFPDAGPEGDAADGSADVTPNADLDPDTGGTNSQMDTDPTDSGASPDGCGCHGAAGDSPIRGTPLLVVIGAMIVWRRDMQTV